MSKTSLPNRFRALYGGPPWHLLLVVASLALAIYAVSTLGLSKLWNPDVWWQSILVWFAGAIIAHDLILFPLYASADRIFLAVRGKLASRRSAAPTVSILNHVRVPLLAIGLLFLIYFPGIIGQGADSYMRATGQTQEPFFVRWLVISAIIVALSAILYVFRLGLTKRRQAKADHQTAEFEPQS